MASSRLFVTASGQRRPRLVGRVLLTAVLLFLVLFTALVAPWPLVHPPTAQASAQGNPNPPLKAPPPRQFHSKPPDLRKFGKSNPRIQASILSRSWFSSAPALTVTLSTQTQQVVTQDGRIRLTVAAGTLSAGQVSSAGGKILLRVSQVLPASGGTPGDQISFGTYLFQLQNASDAPLTGLTLAHPLTITYHLSPAQVRFLIRSQKVYAIVRGGDASTVISGVAPSTGSVATSPTLLLATGDSSGANWSISTTLTTSQQTAVLPFSTITFGTQSPAATWGTPQDFQVDLNAGGLMYTYPLDLPSGPGDFTP